MTVPKCGNRRELGFPDHSTPSPEALVRTESQSQSRSLALTPHPWEVEPTMRPTYRPRTHDALYMDAAIGVNVKEPLHGGGSLPHLKSVGVRRIRKSVPLVDGICFGRQTSTAMDQSKKMAEHSDLPQGLPLCAIFLAWSNLVEAFVLRG